MTYLYWVLERTLEQEDKSDTRTVSVLISLLLLSLNLMRTSTSPIAIIRIVNLIELLIHPTSLLSSLDQLDVRTATSVQTFDFSTLYTSISHDLLKSRISNLVHNAFRKKDGSVRYTHIKVTRAKGYFTHDINSSGDNMYTADNICKMIEFLIDNILCSLEGIFSVR